MSRFGTVVGPYMAGVLLDAGWSPQDLFKLYAREQMSINDHGDVSIDEDQDGFADYSFGNPDFNLIQWRSNMVLRFEYIPGSELFLVWSQSSSSFGNPSDQLLNSLEDNLFSNALRNVFLLKLTYRFVR